ncbi:MAG: hypothetical protein IPJ22_02955 [Bacteroidetes bacterium]|nr:hypothetical protein [Bacteroidota bacterium]
MFLKDKIESIVDDLKLDLKGKVVLTEAATGAYICNTNYCCCCRCKSVCLYSKH